MAPKSAGKKKSTVAPKRSKAQVVSASTSAKAAGKKNPASKKPVKSPAPVAAPKRKTAHAASLKTVPVKTAPAKKPPVARDPKALPPARKPSIYQPQQVLGPSAEAPMSEDQLRKIKSGLNRKDLEHYATLLWQKRREILGDVESLQSDRDAKNAGGDLSNMPLHMADVGSDNYEQEFTLHLVESERKLLHEINDALLRIKKGIYGVCIESGRPIAKARLDAKPWAKYCIEVAREKERQGRM